MVRRIVIALLRLALRAFFRRVEVAGVERVPRGGAVVFVLNHPNALVDPAFLLCLAPRPVSFLAKSTLFKMPVLGYFVRAMGAIPVYRRQDAGEDTARNRETFERARSLLASGGSIGVCPEGVSHDEPSLRPFKSGASRIALGAVSLAAGEGRDLQLAFVPAGLYYTAKTSFRSSALLYFGEPLAVGPVSLDEAGEPPRGAVQELNRRVERALREVTLNAEHHEALATVARAERIFSADEEDGDRGSGDAGDSRSGATGQGLARELRLRRRFVEAYALMRARAPERVAALEARIAKYEEELRQAGFRDPRDLSTATLSKHAATRHVLARLAVFTLLAPLAFAGAVSHFPAYRLAGFLSTKVSGAYEDVVATAKIIAALLLFPLTWLAVSVLAWRLAGWRAALLALALAPLSGWVALRFAERFDEFAAGLRALAFFTTERRFFTRLLRERRAIRQEIIALGEEAAALSAAPGGAGA